jgi:hypothetical protein
MRNILSNASLVVASTLLAVVLLCGAGEVLLRLKYGALPTQVDMRVYDEQRGWALRPGRYAYFDVKALRRVDVTINELGLRNAPLAPEPGPGVERITLLGDSFIFGVPVDEGATISARLQALAGSGYEIVNVGIPGYGTGQQYLLLEELRSRGYRLGSKVVLAFFTNDLQDNLGLDYSTLARYAPQPAFSVDSAGNLRHTEARRPPAGSADTRVSWFDRSLFLQFVRYQAEVLAVSHPWVLACAEAIGVAPRLPRTPGIIAGWYGVQWQDMWRVSENVIEHAIKSLRRTPDAPELYLAFVPSPFQVHESFKRTVAAGADSDARYASFLSDPDRPQRMLEALARRLEVPFIDLTAPMRQAAEQSLLYFPREGHFNELGSAIAAQVIYERAVQKAH